MMVRFTITLVFGFVMAPFASASSSITFSSDKAVVLVEGPQGDIDAPNLFAAMNVSAVDTGSMLQKHVSFTDSQNRSVFDLVCNLSKSVANLGSCTLQIYKIDGMVFDPVKNQVISSIQGVADTSKVATLFFRPPDQTGIIYFSVDKRLGISLDYDAGYPELFMIQYGEEFALRH